MSLIITEDPNDYPLAPQGIYPAVIVDAVDLGELDSPWGPKHKCSLIFELNEVNEETGKQYIVGKRYTASLNEKANLRKDLERWRGKKFTVDELKEGIDLEELIGYTCQVLIVHHETDERVFANIDSLLPPAKIGKGDPYHSVESSGSYTRLIERPDFKQPQEYAEMVNHKERDEIAT